MKVAIFTTNDLTEHNAASNVVSGPLKHFGKFKSLEIDLFAPNDIPSELKNYLKYRRYTTYDTSILRFLSGFSAIPKLLTGNYDLYHCFGEKAVSLLLIAQIIKRKKSPILYSWFEISRTVDIETKILGKKTLRNRIIRQLKNVRRNLALKHTHALVAPTEAFREYLIKHNIYGKEILVIPWGIDLELFGRNHQKDQRIINKMGLENKKVIMYAGEITALHGVLDLVKAVEIINNKVDNVALLIVGDGSWAPMVKEYVKKNQIKNVFFTGRVPRKDLPRYHSIADVLVIPHIRRIDTDLVFPSKLLEYLASGKPIVSSNLKATSDVVGDNAILVEPENPSAFADGILELINNERLAKKLAENGRKIIYNYSWEEIAKKTYKAYRDLVFSNEKF